MTLEHPSAHALSLSDASSFSLYALRMLPPPVLPGLKVASGSVNITPGNTTGGSLKSAGKRRRCIWQRQRMSVGTLPLHPSTLLRGRSASMADQVCCRERHCRAFTLRVLAAQGLSYRKTEGDEVEDMLQLIAHVQRHHPQLQAVSSGAIASDYQRLRVEHVSHPRRQAPQCCSCHPALACGPSLIVFTRSKPLGL